MYVCTKCIILNYVHLRVYAIKYINVSYMQNKIYACMYVFMYVYICM